MPTNHPSSPKKNNNNKKYLTNYILIFNPKDDQLAFAQSDSINNSPINFVSITVASPDPSLCCVAHNLTNLKLI